MCFLYIAPAAAVFIVTNQQVESSTTGTKTSAQQVEVKTMSAKAPAPQVESSTTSAKTPAQQVEVKTMSAKAPAPQVESSKSSTKTSAQQVEVKTMSAKAPARQVESSTTRNVTLLSLTAKQLTKEGNELRVTETH